MTDFKGKLDAHLDRQLDNHLASLEESDRIDEMKEKRLEEILNDGEMILEAINEYYDGSHVLDFVDELGQLLKHGGDKTDEKFLEAARGIYDGLVEIVEWYAGETYEKGNGRCA